MTASLSHSNSQIIMSQTAKSLKNESDKRSHVRGRFVFLIGSNQRCSETRNPPGFVWLFKNWTRLLPPLWPAATVWFKGSIYTGNTINISCLLTILCSGISPRSSRRIRLLYRCRVRQRVKTIANKRILCDTDCRCFSQRSLFDVVPKVRLGVSQRITIQIWEVKRWLTGPDDRKIWYILAAFRYNGLFWDASSGLFLPLLAFEKSNQPEKHKSTQLTDISQSWAQDKKINRHLEALMKTCLSLFTTSFLSGNIVCSFWSSTGFRFSSSERVNTTMVPSLLQSQAWPHLCSDNK